MDAKVSQKGEVTIPKEFRDQLGISEGTLLEMTSSDGKLILEKKATEDPFNKWTGRGKLPDGFKSVDDYLKFIRHGHSSR